MQVYARFLEMSNAAMMENSYVERPYSGRGTGATISPGWRGHPFFSQWDEFCYVGDTDAEAQRIAEKISWFITVSLKQGPQFERFLPGQVAPELAPGVWRGGRGRAPRDVRAESLIANGQLFAGNPDTVVRQIKEFRRRVGGLGRLIMMTRQGFVTHAEAQRSYSAVAAEVLPQLAELEPLEDDEVELVSSRG